MILNDITNALHEFNGVQEMTGRKTLTGQEIGLLAGAIIRHTQPGLAQLREILERAQSMREIELQKELDRATDLIVHFMVRGESLEIETSMENVQKDSTGRVLLLDEEDGHLILRVIRDDA